MNANELLNRILFLIPDAKFSVWESTLDEYMGETTPIPMEKFLIDWNPLNAVPCPTYDAVLAVKKNEVDATVEAKRKQERNREKGKDLAIIAGYEAEKKGNPNLSFSDYLDFLESKIRS